MCIFIIFIELTSVLAAPEPSDELKFICTHAGGHLNDPNVAGEARGYVKPGEVIPNGRYSTCAPGFSRRGVRACVPPVPHPYPTCACLSLGSESFCNRECHGVASRLAQPCRLEYVNLLEVRQDMDLKPGSATYKLNNLGKILKPSRL